MYMVTWKEPGGDMWSIVEYVDGNSVPWFDDYDAACEAALKHANKYPDDVVMIRNLHWGGTEIVKSIPDPMDELRQRIIALAVDMGVWSKVEFIENYQVLLLEGEGHGDISLKFERVI